MRAGIEVVSSDKETKLVTYRGGLVNFGVEAEYSYELASLTVNGTDYREESKTGSFAFTAEDDARIRAEFVRIAQKGVLSVNLRLRRDRLCVCHGGERRQQTAIYRG